MLVFIDETWQTVGGERVGALGAVAIPQKMYNRFCREIYAIKANVLGATEFTDSEFKGQNCFTKAAFKREALHGDSYWLEGASQLFNALEKSDARAFGVWTKSPALLTLRNPKSTALSKPYKQLLFDLRAFMRNEGADRLATLNLDERDHREDAATARAISNYLIRTSDRGANRWDRYFITIPSFTASAISPGLQAADVSAYLVAHHSDREHRPELKPFVDRLVALRYEYQSGRRRRTVRCLRRVN